LVFLLLKPYSYHDEELIRLQTVVVVLFDYSRWAVTHWRNRYRVGYVGRRLLDDVIVITSARIANKGILDLDYKKAHRGGQAFDIA
jgi:hypothetical protein